MSVMSMPEGVVCEANIAPEGIRRRTQVGVVGLVLALAGVAGAMAVGAAWYWRALVFIPAGLSAFGFIQARRRTCVARAAEGVIELGDFSRKAQPPEKLAASRRVAKTIQRDALLVAVGAAALAVATAWVR